MYIHYDEITKRVTSYTEFILEVPDVWKLPTIEVTGFEFTADIVDYEIQNGVPVLVGKTTAMVDDINSKAATDRILLVEEAVTAFLDDAARLNGYDNIINASLRAALPNSPYHLEGVAYGEWMDTVWAYCYTVLEEVEAGTRTEPTIEELIAELPALGAI